MRKIVGVPLLLTTLAAGCRAPPPCWQGTSPTAASQMPSTFNPASAQQIGTLAFWADTRVVDVAPNRIEIVVAMSNVGPQRVRIVEFGFCGTPVSALRAYHTPDRSGPPAWEWRETGVCRLPGGNEPLPDLAPGRFLTAHQTLASTPELLGDSLPPGRYYFTAVIPWAVLGIPGTERALSDNAAVAAGFADLRAAQAPLPAMRTRDGLVFRAATTWSGASPQNLRTIVTISNPSRCPASLRLFNHPFAVYAYQHAERSGKPAWGRWRAAHADSAPIVIPPGGSRSLHADFTASAVLGDSLPDGVYHFAAAVAPQHSSYPLVLSAGEARLTQE